jgi:hypothetical protein
MSKEQTNKASNRSHQRTAKSKWKFYPDLPSIDVLS